MPKLILGVTAGLLVCLLAGWVWGRSGRSEIVRSLDAAELRSDLRGARAAVLDARVAIYSVNFGQASSHLENARNLLRRADERLKSLSRDDAVRQLEPAFTGLDEAQRMAGKLDQSANSRAGDVAKTIADVLDAETGR